MTKQKVIAAEGSTLFLTRSIAFTCAQSLCPSYVLSRSRFCVCLSDVCRNSGEIIKASGSFLNEGGGQTLFCIAHGSSSKTSPIFSIIQVRIALFLSCTGNIHEAEGIYI